jgi:beta-N-acetylhexosaminidase
MRFLRSSFLLVALSGLVISSPAQSAVKDPASWSNKQLVAQTIFLCSSGAGLNSYSDQVRAGLGGIALVGNGTTSQIKKDITALRKLSSNGVNVAIASDEEGGAVQRLKKAIYPLSSAQVMGTWSDSKLSDTAYQYGLRMKQLGVDIAFSPVADLAVPGFFIANNQRAFGSTASKVSSKVIAWASGLKRAGVEPTVKHWPGHGGVGDTHKYARSTASLGALESKDMIPFNAAFSSGVKLVMVGHLMVPGLTEPHTPASRSVAALTYLRNQIGADGVIVTDSLSMGGPTAGLPGKSVEAVIRSLKAGADIALVCSAPKNIISQVSAAVDKGRLERSLILDKVRRILALKSSLGLIAQDR